MEIEKKKIDQEAVDKFIRDYTADESTKDLMVPIGADGKPIAEEAVKITDMILKTMKLTAAAHFVGSELQKMIQIVEHNWAAADEREDESMGMFAKAQLMALIGAYELFTGTFKFLLTPEEQAGFEKNMAELHEAFGHKEAEPLLLN